MPTKKSSTLSGRTWRLLRLALLCAWKGSAIRRRLVSGIERALCHLKSFRGERNSSYNYRLYYGEHELSFDETPTFQFKKHRSHFFPCVDAPLVSFDNDDDDGVDGRKSMNDGCEDDGSEGEENSPPKGIDSQAEEFISRFYKEMELQRQVSFLRYTEMLHRGMS